MAKYRYRNVDLIRKRRRIAALLGGSDGSATGTLLSAIASLIAGAAVGDATAPGDLVTATASTVAGAATGAADVTGASVVATAQIIAGTASGDAVDGNAAGDTVVSAASLLSGTASTQAEVRIFGGWFPAEERRKPQRHRPLRHATALGDTIVASIALRPGRTRAAARTKPAQIVTATARLAPGSARGDARARGALLAARSTLLPGRAYAGARAMPTEVATAVWTIEPGAAEARRDLVLLDNDFLLLAA